MIKKLSFLALFGLLISASSYSQGINFEESTWQEALEKAKSENKLLFVDAYAKWCGPCKRMAKYEFTKSEVGEYYNTNFINLKLDMETPNGRTFDSKYPVSAYPTMFFLDGNGELVKRVKGGKKGSQLITMAKQVMSTFDFSGDFKVKYDEGDRSYETVYNYIKTLNQSGKPSLAISNDYLSSIPEITEDQRFEFVLEAAVEADSKLFEEVASNKERAISVLGEDKYNKNIKRACNNTVKKAIEYEFAELLDEAIVKAESLLTTGKKEFVLASKKFFAYEMRDQDMYTSSVKSLSKIYLKKEANKIKSFAVELMTSKIKSEKINDIVIDLSKTYHDKIETADSAVLYARALMYAKEQKKAVKFLDKMIKALNKAGEKTSSLENFKKIIESKKA